MMGERTVAQEALFYEFSLERHVPADHLLRSIDRFVDLSEHPRAPAPLLQRHRSALDRSGADDPHADHRLHARHPVRAPVVRRGPSQPRVSLVLQARSRRCRSRPLDLLKNRHGRFRDSDLLRRPVRATVERCLAEGLVGGEGFAVDGSLIRADANRQRGHTELPSEASSRAVREYLEVLDDAAFGGASPVAPKAISPTDPAARWTAQQRRPCRVLLRRPTTSSILITASSSMSRLPLRFARPRSLLRSG